MRAIVIENSGTLVEEEQEYFGGKYSLWQRIKMKGTGSPKFLYLKGIPAFEVMQNGIENEMNFVSFELLPNGLILRLNRTQKLAAAGLRLDEIDTLLLYGYRDRKVSGIQTAIPQFSQRGILKIVAKNGAVAHCYVPAQHFQGVLQFLQKTPLLPFLEYQLSEVSVSEDFPFLADLVAKLS